jgi:hypothetical protein
MLVGQAFQPDVFAAVRLESLTYGEPPMFTTLALIRQRLAALRAAVDELADLAAEAEQTEAAGATLLPPETQSQLLLDLDRIGERLEKIGEEISGTIDPRLVLRDHPEGPARDSS